VREIKMVEPLSKQLSDLSIRAKNAEDAAAAAEKEAHDKIVARVNQARAAATAATEKVDQAVKSAKDKPLGTGTHCKQKFPPILTL